MRHLIALSCALLAACSGPPVHVIVDRGLPASPHEEGRVAEAIVGLPSTASFNYDIGLSGFVSENPVDLAVLREYCRPYRVRTVTEQSIPFIGTLTAQMYVPRLVQVSCDVPTAAR